MQPRALTSAVLAILVWNYRAPAADWPQWRGPSRNGISTERIATNWASEGPKTRWNARVGTGFSGVSIDGGRACTLGNTSNQDSVCCFNSTNGALLWKHSYFAPLSPQWYEGGPGATPTFAGNRVYTISKWGDVFCFDAATGAVVWQRDLRESGIKPNRWGFAGSPLVWRDRIILNAGEAGTALDRNDGRILWSNGTNATGYASPVVWRTGRSELVLIFAAQHLVAVDPADGTEHWRYPWKTDWDTNNSDPILHKDHVFLSSFSHGCSLLSLKAGAPSAIYESKTICNNLSPGVLLGNFYYVFSGEAKKDTELRCIDISTGQLQWSAKEPSFGSLIATPDNIVVLTEKGELLVFGKDLARTPNPEPIARARVLSGTCWTPPSLANGLLYVRSAKGEVRCLDVSSTL